MNNARGPTPSAYGLMSARIAPSLHIPNKPEPAPIGSRILAVLRTNPLSAMGLASALDVKELLVTQTLACMAHEGLVLPGAMPVEGRRVQRWSIASRDSAHVASGPRAERLAP